MPDWIVILLGTLLRHGLTTVGGGILVSAGTDTEALTGAILTVLGAVLSVGRTYHMKKNVAPAPESSQAQPDAGG